MSRPGDVLGEELTTTLPLPREVLNMTPRMSPVGCSSESSVEKEMDNLVEEVYIAKQSIHKGMLLQNELKELMNGKLSLEEERATIVGDKVEGEEDGVDAVISIDLGTAYSGYAFAFTHSSDKQIHIMRQSHGGDRGLNNQKVPTSLLLTPEQKFHSFGFAARDSYHDLDSEEAARWYYFDKFKMHLHNNEEISRESSVEAANGRRVAALVVWAEALGYLRRQAEAEIGQSICLRWVITVPALWSQCARQFIREAAYMAEISSPLAPERLLIALEPEAASICCRNLHYNQITQPAANHRKGRSYMVVDCGGGTVDITVHSVSSETGGLRELHKATGGPAGSLGIDAEFWKVMCRVFGSSIMKKFKLERPGAHHELCLAFEARKRSACLARTAPYNLFLPYAFIDFFRKTTGSEVESAVADFNCPDLKWSSDGVLKIYPGLMYQLFQPTVSKILDHIEAVVGSRQLEERISHLFLVGGFSESQILQEAVTQSFSNRIHIIIPQAVSLSVLKGGVLYGLDPSLVSSRKVTYTYGIGVVKPFLNGIHPPEKLVVRQDERWCADVLERMVESGEAVAVGQVISRRFTPASAQHSHLLLHLYATLSKTAQFITDPEVHKCGSLRLELGKDGNKLREITVSLVFGGTEVQAYAADTATGHSVHTTLDFIPK